MSDTFLPSTAYKIGNLLLNLFTSVVQPYKNVSLYSAIYSLIKLTTVAFITKPNKDILFITCYFVTFNSHLAKLKFL